MTESDIISIFELNFSPMSNVRHLNLLKSVSGETGMSMSVSIAVSVSVFAIVSVSVSCPCPCPFPDPFHVHLDLHAKLIWT
jgi:hypothetical protein